jgi:FtsZ-binding cell division protein ZapB
LASHDNGTSRGVLNIGSDYDGPYLSMAAADGSRRIGLIVNDDSGASINLRGAIDVQNDVDSLGQPIYGRPILVQLKVDKNDSLSEESGAIYVANASGEKTISLNGSTGNLNIAGILTQNSDARLKKDINTLEGALKNVTKMRGVSYHWKDESRTSAKQIGVIAQEIESIYPEFVSEDNNGTKSVNYAQMTAVLIEAVKELNAEIASLKETNEILKTEVSNAKQLEDRLLQIEKLLGVKTNDTANANK